MFDLRADPPEQLLTLRYSQRVGPEEMKRCVQGFRDLLGEMRPGFRLLTDLTELEAMEPACAVDIEKIMELCDEKKIGEVVRVIPNPAKDIGFNIMSRFHYGSQVTFRTYDNLAEAVRSLRREPPATD